MRKKLIALLLCFTMIVSIGATTIFALEEDSSPFSEENLQESDVPESEDDIKNVTALLNSYIENNEEDIIVNDGTGDVTALLLEASGEFDDLGDSPSGSVIEPEPTESEIELINQDAEPTNIESTAVEVTEASIIDPTVGEEPTNGVNLIVDPAEGEEPTEPKADSSDEGDPIPSTTEIDENPLHDEFMKLKSKNEIEFYLEGLSEEDYLALLKALTDEDILILAERFGLGEEEIEIFKEYINKTVAQSENESISSTVPYHEAGPFMPGVDVATRAKSMMRAGAPSVLNDSGNGLELNKRVVDNPDGTYTITMEAYTTGTVTSSEHTSPVDFVLVLDQSGSMKDDFSGASNRQAAMQAAVNNFIGSVAEKYDADVSDHRIALVTFSGSAATRKGWTFVDSDGKTELQTSVTTLPTPSGATNVAAGMNIAENLMGSGYDYGGTNTTRQKVVIVFTDGVPTTSNRFNESVATNAIMSSKRLKDSGVTVYSIGVFPGANPAELYGSSGFYTNSNGTVGSRWADLGFIVGDVEKVDVPAGNRFLNYLSSNFKNATSIGLNNKDFWIIVSYLAWEITSNESRTNTGYYLSAANASELDAVFSSIVENIENPSIDLGSETIVLDGVTPYFNVPEDASDVKVYSAPATPTSLTNNDWGSMVSLGLTPTISGDEISVTGFDFTENFVSDKAKEDGSFGNKLIIEFTISLKDGFLGGNAIPTNKQNSGVYSGGSPVGYFDIPRVDIPIADVTVGVVDKNIYLFGDLTIDDLMSGSTAEVGNVSLNLSPTAVNYGLESWQIDGVDIEVLLKDSLGNQIENPLSGLVADQGFSLSVKVLSKIPGDPPPNEKSDSNSGTIKVFKPVLTFKDSYVWYGDLEPTEADYGVNNFSEELWKHQTSADTDVSMIGDKPTLSLTYTPETGKISAGKINSKTDIPVSVDVKIGDQSVQDHTSFVHQACDPVCGWNDPDNPGGPAFLLHVKTGELKIIKSGGNADEPYVFDIYKGGVKYTEATILGNDSVTIYELPVGTYTIQEDTGWSWRFVVDSYNYEPELSDNTAGIKLGSEVDSGTITCVNALNNINWLNGYSKVVENMFDSPHTQP